MRKEKCFSPAQCSVLIPYRELEKLLAAAERLEELEQKLRRTDERTAAMQMMFTELAEKVAEIDRYL